jgi:hypothetical protein
VQATESDEALATAATALLVEQGRPDLSVSGLQVVRWRQADLLPVVSDRRAGRSRQTVYSKPAAVVVAAEMALALDLVRDIDRGALIAFARGAPVPEAGLVASYVHYLQDAELKARLAWVQRGKPRSEVKRSLRLPVAHSRRGDAGLVSDNVLAILLGKRPYPEEDGAAIAIEGFLEAMSPPGIAETVVSGAPDSIERVAGLADSLALAVLRRLIRKSGVEQLRWGCDVARPLLEYGEVMARLLSFGGGAPAVLPSPLDVLVPLLGAASDFASSKSRFESPDLAVAVMALALVCRCRSKSDRREIDEAAAACLTWLPANRANLQLAGALPDKWHPAFVPGNAAVFLAGLPEAEREELFVSVRGWLAEHPAEAEALQANEQLEDGQHSP